jgi:2-polyprenyl-3-methyl-5-hydroxy-6-metoxy-1,4-benzoquinol methylase
MDKSNGYEAIAPIFISSRGRAVNGVGTSFVRRWAKTLRPGSTVLELGCGTGIPVSKILAGHGMQVHAIDASPSMVQAFTQNFPNTPVACEAAEDSDFFHKKFDAIIAWGLIFIIPEDAQRIVIQKTAAALHPGGKLLFTSPAKAIEWADAMSEQVSRSLGAEEYKRLLTENGLLLADEYEDEGENHYYEAVKG